MPDKARMESVHLAQERMAWEGRLHQAIRERLEGSLPAALQASPDVAVRAIMMDLAACPVITSCIERAHRWAIADQDSRHQQRILSENGR